MTPKKKAKKLVAKMFNAQSKPYCFWEHAKQSALIAVDEILNLDDFSIDGRDYWQEVKREIKKL
jgi:hypothetical protein